MALTLKIVDDNTTVTADVKVLEKLDYFKQMLAAKMREQTSGQVELHDVDTPTVQRLVNYLADSTSVNLTELPYSELCRLHQLADRLVYPELKQVCSDLLTVCLNDATVRGVLTYLATGVIDATLATALVEYISQSYVFQREIVPTLSEEELTVIQGLDLPMTVKIVVALASPVQDSSTLNRVKEWLRQVSESELGDILDHLIAQPTNNLEIQTIILTRLRPLIKTRADPAGFYVVQLNNFDVTKLSLGAPVRHQLFNMGVSYTTVPILYEGRSDWVLKLPPFRFPGLHVKYDPGQRPSFTLQLRYSEIQPDLPATERGPLVAHLDHVLQSIDDSVVMNLFTIRHALQLNVATAAQVRNFIPSLVKSPPPNGALPPGNPNPMNSIWMKIKSAAVFRDHGTNQLLQPASLAQNGVGLAEPYIMHNGLLRLNRIYCGHGRFSIQSEFMYGYVERTTPVSH
jgi:hypothetical protein